MAWKPEPTAGAIRTDCPRCSAPVYHQRHGLPLVVTADAEKLTLAEAEKRTGPNRLAWCLRESKWTGARLVEVSPSVHRRDCTAHVVDHECPPGTPAVKGALW